MGEMKIRIITDSASDMDASAREGMSILPMAITFGEEEFQDGVNLSHREFYERLVESDELPRTSQVTPYAFEEAFRQAAEEESPFGLLQDSGAETL